MEHIRIKVKLKNNPYSIFVERGILKHLEKHFSLKPYSSIFVISNKTVYPLYGQYVEKYCAREGKRCETYLLSDGEVYKSWDEAKKILDDAIESSLDRKSLIIALGGGVVGDIAGFVAAIYMRGIAFLNIPTTLLACVDSSVGGKVAVNHSLMKNALGFFHQPSTVLIDLDTFKTLPKREYVAGLAEVIKYAIIWSKDLFDFLEKQKMRVLQRDECVLQSIVEQSCQIKACVVEQDEKENGLRAILNFGHTFGHALESATSYHDYLHGEAISIGMVLEGSLAVKKSLWKQEDCDRMISLIDSYGLPVKTPQIPWDTIFSSLSKDKKFTGQQMVFILPRSIGKVDICKTLTLDDVKNIYEEFSGHRD